MSGTLRRVNVIAASVFGSIAMLAGACAGTTNGGACNVGSDCASGVCQDGACVEASGGGSSAGGGAQGGAGGAADGGGGSASGGSSGDGGSGSGGGGACKPNHDGTISRDEVPITAGLSAKFETATDVTFATSGTMKGDGTRDWNMVGPFAGDHLDLIETLAMTGQWFAADFSGATYAAKLSDTSDLLGVFEVTNDALLLRGVVSPADGLQKTELTYDPPVKALAFPLTQGATWSTDATVTGYAEGVFSTYTESYANGVDASGSLETPFGTFDVLRVKTKLTRTVGFVTTTIHSFGFTAECFGTVATVSSKDNETEDEFSDAAELKRLSP